MESLNGRQNVIIRSLSSFMIRLQNVLTLEHLPVELWCVHELIESDDIAAIIPAIRVINIDAAGATWEKIYHHEFAFSRVMVLG
ncbi:uncharacterized protein PITG_02523 [Phytophthora infestans T30-4]|uniref:Uncharacterized protein n=1 Tax=Phytophthora infestans (strain T30-4) TaxID=403677 RepID=D0MWJ3_PHYIT|nr:uncharacterized protein PITG_02523 [Phytophthora infestans T30-4]EEY64006.1 hypothetical protein PITG_02523 [Phytophthora infestans T30-4]|eukprot:XP_002907442.1 hypothetical protein PITG_02523 [Phytophthora infestans T30-4]